MENKICKTCKNLLSLSEFDKDKNGHLGVRGSCKKCTKKGKDHKRIKARLKQVNENNKKHGNIDYWNERARSSNRRVKSQYGINEKITGLDLFNKYNSSKECFYCSSKISHLEAEIEHVESLYNNGNHCIDNIQFACTCCNKMKGVKNDTDFFKHIETIYNTMKNKCQY